MAVAPTVIIPARLHSSRLPRKMLLDFGGVPLCVATARQAAGFLRTVIATDAEPIAAAARAHGIEAVLTSAAHESGSERLAEAAQILGLADEALVINLQGDEPLFGEQNLREFAAFAAARAGEYFMASAYFLDAEPADENAVKVACSRDDYALYFSRAQIPYARGAAGGFDAATCAPWRHHLGIYAYSVAALKEFVALPSELEHIEKLEQLRALENGKKILLTRLERGGVGIDSEADYRRACQQLASSGR